MHNPFRYSGEYWDETTKLQYSRARWYDHPYKGDITSPLSQNLYTYVHNNALIYIDPSGNAKDSFGAALTMPKNPQEAVKWQMAQKCK